jgi:cytoskeletal protein RodZ
MKLPNEAERAVPSPSPASNTIRAGHAARAPGVTQDAAADHATAGAMLRDARLALRLTIEELAGETRIPARTLRAIETGAFDDPLSRDGAVAYAATYARRLGVDEDRVTEAVRAALSPFPVPRCAPIEHVEERHDRLVAIAAAATLFVAFLLAAAGWCAWMLR